MKFRHAWLVPVAALGLAFVSFAQEPPKEEVPKVEAPKEAPPAEAAPAEAAKPAAPEAPKEVSACASSLQPLADSYKKAHDDLQKWIAEVDAQTSAANASVVKLQAEVQANEDATTKAKLAGDDAKVKELTKGNKQLWSQLDAAKKAAAAACGPVAKQAADRVKQYDAATAQALTDLKAKAK